MPLFARRDIQDRIFALGEALPAEQLAGIVERLNDHERDRLAALWEVVVLHAFSTIGVLTSEAELVDGKRPDILLKPKDPAAAPICADITAVSDEGLEADNPAREFLRRVARAARKVGYSGGHHVRIGDRREPVRGGHKIVLMAPAHAEMDRLVRDLVEPYFRRARKEPGLAPLAVETETVKFAISCSLARNSSVHHASYRKATSLVANPLMNRLKSKARKQLRNVPHDHFKGIVACDGFSDALRGKPFDYRSFSRFDIASAFMAQNRSIDFVLFVSTVTRHLHGGARQEHRLDAELVVRPGMENHPSVALMKALPAAMPTPIRSLSMASGMAREKGVGTRGYGALRMTNNTIRISVRMLMDILAGRTSFAELNRGLALSRPNPFEDPAVLARLLTRAEVVRGDSQDDDDFIEFEFGPRDALNGPYMAARPDAPTASADPEARA